VSIFLASNGAKHVTYETYYMPKVFTSEKQQIGELGENIAVKFLVKRGFSVIDRNYTKKWGEIDIVAEKSDKLYFIEVKSVSRATLSNVSPETESYKAEDNMHPWKLQRLSRTIQTYLLSKKVPDEKGWQVDLLVVYLNLKAKKAKVKVVSDIIL
jgi:putative endonuclease